MTTSVISQTSFISNVDNSAVIFRYKRYAKVSVFLTVTSQIGMNIANSLFDCVSSPLTSDQSDLLSYMMIAPLILSPLIAGFFLEKKFSWQTLCASFLFTFIGQISLTISTFIHLPFSLVAVGRILFIVGYSMAAPSLVKIILMWLHPEVIPMGLAILFLVQIFSQNAGSLLYSLVFYQSDISLWISQAISLALCLSSVILACGLGYIEQMANRDPTDANMLMQQTPPELSRLLNLSKRVWGILLSTSATLACIYIFQVFNIYYIGNITEHTKAVYVSLILGGFSMIGLPIFAKTIKVERQRLLLLVVEQLLTVIGFCILYFLRIGWIMYISATSLLGISQAALYLTFFIILLSIIKWEFLGIIIGIFYSLRNLESVALLYSMQYLNEKEEESSDSPSKKFKNLVLLVLGGSLIFGFLISFILFFKNRNSRVREDPNSEVMEPLRRENSDSAYSEVLASRPNNVS